MRKIPFAEVELTSQRVRGLRGTSELPWRPASVGDDNSVQPDDMLTLRFIKNGVLTGEKSMNYKQPRTENQPGEFTSERLMIK